jgi:hypothetical protein
MKYIFINIYFFKKNNEYHFNLKNYLFIIGDARKIYCHQKYNVPNRGVIKVLLHEVCSQINVKVIILHIKIPEIKVL